MNIVKIWIVIMLATLPSLAAPVRIVCLGGTVTETAWALGAGAEIVAIDDSSTFPPEVAKRPRIGYYRMVSAEGVLQFRPDLVLAAEEAGPPEVMSRLVSAGIPVVRISGSASITGCIQRIHQIGQALDLELPARELAASIENQLNDWLTGRPDLPPKRVLFVFSRGAGFLNVAGEGTAADAVIRLIGADNAAVGFRGYRPMTAEAVVMANPDVILITTSSIAGLAGVDEVWNQPGMSATKAFKNRSIAVMDDLLLLGFGPRLPEAVRSLHSLIYP